MDCENQTPADENGLPVAAASPAPGAQPQEVQNAAWRKWADAGTVGGLIGFLATLDQDAPIVTAYHVTLGSGERLCKTRSLTISRERVDHATSTIRSSDTALPYTHVMWAQPRDEAQASAVKDDETAWELPTPAVGDYVLATKWSDGDPGDNWAIGFYTHSDTLNGGQTRHYVADSAGKNIRGNGFRKVHGPIRGDVGRWLLEVASKQLEASPPGVVNLWTMLTPFAFDLERDREPVSQPPVQD